MIFVFLIFRNYTKGRAARSSKMEVLKGLNGLSKTSNCKPGDIDYELIMYSLWTDYELIMNWLWFLFFLFSGTIQKEEQQDPPKWKCLKNWLWSLIEFNLSYFSSSSSLFLLKSLSISSHASRWVSFSLVGDIFFLTPLNLSRVLSFSSLPTSFPIFLSFFYSEIPLFRSSLFVWIFFSPPRPLLSL